MEEGGKLDQEKVKAALEKGRLKFVSMKEVEMPLPKASYVMRATGIG